MNDMRRDPGFRRRHAFPMALLIGSLLAWALACSSESEQAGSGLADTQETGGDTSTTELGFVDTDTETGTDAISETSPDLVDISPELDPETDLEVQEELSSEPNPELEPELEPEIIAETSPEIVPDTGPEVITGSSKAYLVTSLGVDAPELCMPSGATCVPMNGLMTAYFQSAIDDPEAPLLIMALFEDFLNDEATQAMRFGNASCDWDDDLAQSCSFDLSDPKNVADLTVSYVLAGACGDGVTGPCFQTDPQEVFLSFPLFASHFGLLATEIRGAFQGLGLGELGAGEIRGFLPRSLAEKYQVSGVGAEPVLVSDLFVDPPVEVNGVEGWWMSLSVTGREIDYAGTTD
jgi:hypothetical protein